MFEARDYQNRIVEKTLDHLQIRDSVLIESPTGSGKTVMGMMVAKHFADKGARVGWTAMRRNLLTQAIKTNEQFDFGFKIEAFSMFDKNPPPVDFLVVDEAHHDATASMEMIYHKIKPSKHIGLTATPARADAVDLCFARRVTDAGISELVKMGYLANYRQFEMKEYTPDSVCKHYLKSPEKWGKSVVFFRTYEECIALQQKLIGNGFDSVDIVTANTDRDTQLAKFANGETKMIINMMVLTEGFDSPSLETVWVRDSSKSPTVQMAGRVFRQHNNMLKNVVQSLDTRFPMYQHVDPIERYIELEEGEWMSVGLNNDLQEIISGIQNQMMMNAISSLEQFMVDPDE